MDITPDRPCVAAMKSLIALLDGDVRCGLRESEMTDDGFLSSYTDEGAPMANLVEPTHHG